MTTTLQIRAEISLAERFRGLWDRLKVADPAITQGETLEMALDCLTEKLDAKVKNVITGLDLGQNVDEEKNQLKAMLKRVVGSFYECPVCGSPPAVRNSRGHAPDCELDQLLGGRE